MNFIAKSVNRLYSSVPAKTWAGFIARWIIVAVLWGATLFSSFTRNNGILTIADKILFWLGISLLILVPLFVYSEIKGRRN